MIFKVFLCEGKDKLDLDAKQKRGNIDDEKGETGSLPVTRKFRRIADRSRSEEPPPGNSVLERTPVGYSVTLRLKLTCNDLRSAILPAYERLRARNFVCDPTTTIEESLWKTL